MRISFTARHCTVSEELRARAERLLTKAAATAHRPQRADVVFGQEGGRRTVELHLHLPQGRIKNAVGEADDFRSALDTAVGKLRNQLGKNGRRRPRRAEAE